MNHYRSSPYGEGKKPLLSGPLSDHKWFFLNSSGRGLFVAKQIVDAELPLHQLETQWLGEGVAGLFEMGRSHLQRSSGKDPIHYLERS